MHAQEILTCSPTFGMFEYSKYTHSFTGLLLKSFLLIIQRMTTHTLIWLSSSCIPNRRSESLLVTVDDEDTDFERVVCPEIPDLF